MQLEILQFMRKHKDKRYNTKQLKKVLGVENRRRIQTALYKLWQKGYVQREATTNEQRTFEYKYWAT